MRWVCGTRVWDLDQRPLIVGIINVTPDSFSGGIPDSDQAVAHGERLVSEGADLLDVGGESTRPGADAVSEYEELKRVLPVVERLVSRVDTPLSVDTRRLVVAQKAVDRGVRVVNHVSASLEPHAMLPLLKSAEVAYVAMHMAAPPKVMQQDPKYDDVVAEVGGQLMRVKEALMEAGISPERCLFDPGIGFGKTLQHNLTLLRGLDTLAQMLNSRLLVGLSRKSWLGQLLGLPVDDRDLATAVASALLPFPAVAVHRVHHVSHVRQALELRARLLFRK